MKDLPAVFKTYVTAVMEATEISMSCEVPIYLFRIMEGGYCVDFNPDVYSNEKLIIKLFKGEAI